MLETLETPVHSAEKKIVLKAISESPGKILVADIATKTGLPVLQTSGLLNQIAYETGGHLTVGTAGSIAYEFANNFQNAYIARSSKNTFLRFWRIIYNASAYLARLFSLLMFFVIRVSFGIILIAAVVLVIVLVVAVVVAIMSKLMGDNDRSDDFDLGSLLGGLTGIFRYWAFDWLWDWWFWGRYIRWDPSPSYTPSIPPSATGPKNKESFLDKCFSFLFGDGDPNAGLVERQWQTLARVIKANNGVVVAEQLAPYVDYKESGEDWVLPILVQFNGNCDVSENGNIIYTFPSFQESKPDATTAQGVGTSIDAAPDQLHDLFKNFIKSKEISRNQAALSSALEPYLKEEPWVLSHVKGGSRTTIIAFAVFITIASLWLMTMSGLIPFLIYLSPLLIAIAAYGAMFLIVPGIRFLIIKQKNESIQKRNSARYLAASKLQNPPQELKTKLNEAAKTRQDAMMTNKQEGIAYSTESDLLDQQFENNS